MNSELMEVRHELQKCERELYNAEAQCTAPEQIQKILDKQNDLNLKLSEIQEKMRTERGA